MTDFNPERCREVMALLHQQAAEIARDGHSGWGNTMAEAADQLEAAMAEIDGFEQLWRVAASAWLVLKNTDREEAEIMSDKLRDALEQAGARTLAQGGKWISDQSGGG